MAELVKLSDAAFKLEQENEQLRERIATMDATVRNAVTVLKAFYDAMRSNNVTDAQTFYNYLEVAVGQVTLQPLPPADQ